MIEAPARENDRGGNGQRRQYEQTEGRKAPLRDSRGPWWLPVHEDLAMLWADPVCLLGAQSPGCSSKPTEKPNRLDGFVLCSAPLPLSAFHIFLSASGRGTCCCPAKGMTTGCKLDSYLKSRGSKGSHLSSMSCTRTTLQWLQQQCQQVPGPCLIHCPHLLKKPTSWCQKIK